MADAFHSDIYGKGGWVLHTLRGLIGEEAFWRSLRRLIYDTPEPWDLPYPIPTRYRSTDDFVQIVEDETGLELSWFFDAYLYQAALPQLVQSRDDNGVTLRWQTPSSETFRLRIPVMVNGKVSMIDMTDGTGFIPASQSDKILIDPDMTVLRALPIIGTCEQQTAIQDARRAQRKKRQEQEYGWKKQDAKK